MVHSHSSGYVKFIILPNVQIIGEMLSLRFIMQSVSAFQRLCNLIPPCFLLNIQPDTREKSLINDKKEIYNGGGHCLPYKMQSGENVFSLHPSGCDRKWMQTEEREKIQQKWYKIFPIWLRGPQTPHSLSKISDDISIILSEIGIEMWFMF